DSRELSPRRFAHSRRSGSVRLDECRGGAPATRKAVQAEPEREQGYLPISGRAAGCSEWLLAGSSAYLLFPRYFARRRRFARLLNIAIAELGLRPALTRRRWIDVTPRASRYRQPIRWSFC